MTGADIIKVYSLLDNWNSTKIASIVENTGLTVSEVEDIIIYLAKRDFVVYNLFGDIYLK